MENNIYLYSDVDDLFFDLSRLEENTKSLKFIDCNDLLFDDFLKMNLKNLFCSPNNIFYNAEHLDKEKLSNFLETRYSKLAFGKIDKRSKLYKLLSNKFNLISISTINSLSLKKDFIRTMLVECGLPMSMLEYFLNLMPNSKFIISQELIKFAAIYKLTKNLDIAKKSVISYGTDSDIFEFLTAFFEKSIVKFYFYLKKIDKASQQLYLIFSKKLMYLIMLSYDNKELARKYMYINDYYMKNDIKLAKKIGSNTLIGLHAKLQNLLGDLYSEVPVDLRLKQLYNYYSEKSSN